tara:strand:+ start:4030 stop:4827 length:798 start_codon:yes stop_codon:yes gene_type:complete
MTKESNKKTLAIIQARMNSSRLPGKVLMPINGRPMLDYMIERISSSSEIDDFVIATSIESSDNPIEEFCVDNNVNFFRGNLDDVLDRFYEASKISDASIIVRLTGDCPLVDPKILDAMIGIYKKNNYDYIANTAPPEGITFPEGMDVEIFSRVALDRAWKEAKKPSEREHVTFYFWKNEDLFSTYRFDLSENLSNYRLTVDYPEDFELVKCIIENFSDQLNNTDLNQIVNFLEDNPELLALNKNIESFSGWTASLEEDKVKGYLS